MSADLLLTHHLRPFPGMIDTHGRSVCGARRMRMYNILETVIAAGYDIGDADPAADVENFWEDAIMIDAVYRAARNKNLTTERITNDTIWTPDKLARRLGQVSIFETGHHKPDTLQDHPLILDPSFAGRTTVATTFNDPHELQPIDFSELSSKTLDHLPDAYANDTITTLRHLYWLGQNLAVVKLSGNKQGVCVIQLSDDAQKLAEQFYLNDTLGWSIVRVEGQPNALRVSPWVPMEYEYRIFIVDGRVITGAGCIEERTPLDHDHADGPFDPWVRKHRGNGIAADKNTDPEFKPELANAYRLAAEKIAALLPPGQDTIQVDLAMVNGEDEPIIVEFNSVPNAGLYAIDAQALANALVVADEKGYWVDYPNCCNVGEYRIN